MSCQEVIQLDLPSKVDAIIVEGWLTDEMKKQTIRITRSTEFYSTGEVPAVENAEVLVRTSKNIYHYSDSASGYYVSDSVFAGIAGNEYVLQIILPNGDTLLSENEKLIDVPAINSLSYDFVLVPSEDDPGVEIKVYYPVIFADDPADTRNFYKWSIYRNDTLFADPEEIELLEDRFFDGNSFQNDFTQFDFYEGDSVTIEVQSLTRSTFDFFTLFRNQTVGLGTSSGNSPAILVGNIRNKSNPDEVILGFFGTTAIKSASTIINEID